MYTQIVRWQYDNLMNYAHILQSQWMRSFNHVCPNIMLTTRWFNDLCLNVRGVAGSSLIGDTA